MEQSFRERLHNGRPLLLDGPTGTELDRRGVNVSGPAWSAAALLSAPDAVRAIHADYVAAGAEVITANTFRTHARNLRAVGLASRARSLTATAVSLAREATSGHAFVAGSLAPLEDCYRPDLVLPSAELEREHALMAESLADAGVDLILAETHNSIREAEIATRVAVRVGLPVLVSFVCGADGKLFSGETVAEAARAVLPHEPAGLLVNCLPAAVVPKALNEFRSVSRHVPLGAYANAGAPVTSEVWEDTDASDPVIYAAAAREWLAQGATIIGGCCGTTPAHLVALREVIAGENNQNPR